MAHHAQRARPEDGHLAVAGQAHRVDADDVGIHGQIGIGHRRIAQGTRNHGLWFKDLAVRLHIGRVIPGLSLVACGHDQGTETQAHQAGFVVHRADHAGGCDGAINARADVLRAARGPGHLHCEGAGTQGSCRRAKHIGAADGVTQRGDAACSAQGVRIARRPRGQAHAARGVVDAAARHKAARGQHPQHAPAVIAPGLSAGGHEHDRTRHHRGLHARDQVKFGRKRDLQRAARCAARGAETDLDVAALVVGVDRGRAQVLDTLIVEAVLGYLAIEAAAADLAG